MNGFFWTSGHLGWDIFAAAVFTGLWILLADIYWRLRRTRMARLLVMVASSWLVGIGLIVLCFFISN